MAKEGFLVHRLSEHVSAIEGGGDVLHLDDTQRFELTDSSSRTVARLAIASELDGAGVVDAQRGGPILMQPHLGQQGAHEHYLASAGAGRDDLGFGGRQRDAGLAFAGVDDRHTCQEQAESGGRVSDGPVRVALGDEGGGVVG